MDADPANVHPLVLFAVRRIINPVERAMLRSRLHQVAGSSTLMLLTYKGRKSGRRFTVPVGYRQDGNALASFTRLLGRRTSAATPTSRCSCEANSDTERQR